MKLIARIKKELLLIDSKFYCREEWPSELIVWTRYLEREGIQEEEELIYLNKSYKLHMAKRNENN